MKNLIALIPFFLILSCTHSEYIGDKKTATIQGTILNTTEQQFEIWQSNEEDNRKTVELEEGKFLLTYELEKPTYFDFKINDEYGFFFLEPGDELSLSITNASHEQFDETISYSGKGAEESNFLAGYHLLKEKTLGEWDAFLEMEPDQFLEKISKSFELFQGSLHQFKNDHPVINPFFVKTQETEMKLEKAMHLLNYPVLRKHFTKKEELDLPTYYYTFVEELDFNNPEFLSLSVSMYVFTLMRYLDVKAEKKFGKLADEIPGQRITANQKFDLVPDLVEDREIRNRLYNNLALGYIHRLCEQEDKEGMDAVLELFMQRCDNEKYQKEIKEKYEVCINLFPGNSAPGFTYSDIKGQQVSLSDFNDKYVYIDIWATWCGPCLKELPHLEKLQDQFNDPRLVFISISIDEDKKAWEKMVEEKEMSGVQLIDSDGSNWNAGIRKDYSVLSIPHFVLIGPGGIIVDSNAPSPSSEEIKEILSDLMSAPEVSMEGTKY